MQQQMFKTKKVGRCEACREMTQGDEKLELVEIINQEFWLCSDCAIGQQDCTPEENEEFIRRYEKRISKS